MDLTDEALVQKFRQTKDSIYFKSLVRRYQNRLFNAAVRILGNSEEAEEVVQDAFVKVHQNLDRFRNQASFGAWVFKIAHNICMDVQRHKLRKKGLRLLAFDPQSTLEADVVADSSSQVVSQIADPAMNPAQKLDFNEQEEIVSKALSELPDAQRTVLILFDIEGFTYQEVADIVGASVGTVRSRLHYGRMKMRELLDPYFSQQNVSTFSR